MPSPYRGDATPQFTDSQHMPSTASLPGYDPCGNIRAHLLDACERLRERVFIDAIEECLKASTFRFEEPEKPTIRARWHCSRGFALLASLVEVIFWARRPSSTGGPVFASEFPKKQAVVVFRNQRSNSAA